MILPPEKCQSMLELRAQIDVLDTELMGLLAKRVGYIDRAAELKQTELLPARIEWRIQEVLDKARENAAKVGFDTVLAEKLWRDMIEWSIKREAAILEKESK